jgi:hypothetical protein
VVFEEGGDAGAVLGVSLHAEAEGLDAAEDEEGVHGSGDGADGVLEEVELPGDLLVAGDDGAADDIGVSVDELGGGVDDDVGAEEEGLWK